MQQPPTPGSPTHENVETLEAAPGEQQQMERGTEAKYRWSAVQKPRRQHLICFHRPISSGVVHSQLSPLFAALCRPATWLLHPCNAWANSNTCILDWGIL